MFTIKEVAEINGKGVIALPFHGGVAKGVVEKGHPGNRGQRFLVNNQKRKMSSDIEDTPYRRFKNLQ
jgi:hypothetical protein